MSKQFQIIALNPNGKEILISDRQFISGDEAAQVANDLNKAQPGIKHQVRIVAPADPNEWISREAKRIENGEYKTVPWHNENWVKKAEEAVHHFVHVSMDDVTKIAFTDSPKRGQADAQIRMYPSKYLQRYYSQVINEETIRRWCATYRKEYGSDFELKFATEEDEIVALYDNGPESCMTGVRAVRAYAGGDLCIAYIVRKKDVTARGVVWRDKKKYYTLYGDTHLLEEVLKENGYKYGSFKGAKLRTIIDHGHRVLPSVDCAVNGFDYGEEFTTIR